MAAKSKKSLQELDLEIADQLAQFYADPLGFVLWAYPWGEPGPLKNFTGPDEDQREFLKQLGEEVKARKFDGKTPVKPIRMVRSSGHGTGKSVRAAWIVNWIMSTRAHCGGTVTANTADQLETKTWAQVQRWTKLLNHAHWFECTSERMWKVGHKETWFCAPSTCREENSEAFAGQHRADSTSFYVFDEGSAVPDTIYEVAEGGLTDGEPMIFVFGNPTKSSGKLYRTCFGSERHRWNHGVIDARKSAFANQDQIAEWIEDYGEDSDFVRVRVRGLPPSAADSQFIPTDLVDAAQKRQALSLPDDPLIAGCDLSWGGEDYTTIRFRQGCDARSIPAIRIPGEQTRDPNTMVMKLSEVLSRDYNGKKVSMLFMDSAGICGPVASRLRQLGFKNIIEVNFGAHSLNEKYAFMRSYMWGQMKEWLSRGAIDKAAGLEEDLTAPGYKFTKKTEILLEPKDKIRERIGHSTDDGDALALTFAQQVAPLKPKQPERRAVVTAWS